jgi:hypothetical protein
MESSVVVGIGSLTVAVVGLLLAYSFGKRRELGMSEWIREFRVWALDVVDVLVRARYKTSSGLVSVSDIEEYIITLSTLVERGRFYLPNQKREKHGREKPEAYRGYRHQTLDILVAAIKILEEVRYTDVRSDYLITLRKLFVSQVTCILDPMAFNTKVAHLLGTSYRKIQADPTCGGLLPGTEIPSGADALLARIEARHASDLYAEKDS